MSSTAAMAALRCILARIGDDNLVGVSAENARERAEMLNDVREVARAVVLMVPVRENSS